MHLRKIWLKFFIFALLIIVTLSVAMLIAFYNSSNRQETARTLIIEEFVRGQKLDLIKNVVNNIISELGMKSKDVVTYDDMVSAMQKYMDTQVPLGDVEIRIDELNNYHGSGNFATRIITPFFQQEGETVINAGNADYFDVFEQLVVSGDAHIEVHSDNGFERIVYARLYRPYDWVVSAGVSARDIHELTDSLSQTFRAQQRGYALVIALFCVFFTVAALALFTLLGRAFFSKADGEFKVMYDTGYIDALTEVYNRRYLDDCLQSTTALLSREENGELSVLMIDIDYFKNYNDTYGHQRGDDCLRLVARSIAGVMQRDSDVTARYGGEEFAVVLPNTGEAGARVIAGKLLECVRGLNIPHEKSAAAPYVTVSIGVTSANVEHTHDWRDYLLKADKALYMSKQTGRNRYTYLSFESKEGEINEEQSIGNSRSRRTAGLVAAHGLRY